MLLAVTWLILPHAAEVPVVRGSSFADVEGCNASSSRETEIEEGGSREGGRKIRGVFQATAIL